MVKSLRGGGEFLGCFGPELGSFEGWVIRRETGGGGAMGNLRPMNLDREIDSTKQRKKWSPPPPK